MITDLEIVPEDNIIVTYLKDGVEKSLKVSELSEYWDFSEDEEPSISVCSVGNMIYGIMTIADDQDGIIFAYDTDSEQIVHVSDGSYGIDFDIADGYVYLLCYVSNFVTKGHFMVLRTEFGVKDSANEGTVIECELPDAEDPISARISVDGNKMTFLIDGNEYVVEI